MCFAVFTESKKNSMLTFCYKSHFDQFLIASKKVMKNNSNLVLKERRKNPYKLFKKKKKSGQVHCGWPVLSFNESNNYSSGEQAIFWGSKVFTNHL